MDVVVVGGGAAGTIAAGLLGEEGHRVTLITEEKYPYYPRPWLIDFLAGERGEGELLRHDETWYHDRGIELNVGEKAKSINPFLKKVITDAGEYEYDHLVVATGSEAYVPPVPGRWLGGVFTLRTLDDARRIVDALPDVRSVSIAGGGVLGVEVAHAIRKRCGGGVEITIYEKEDRLMPLQLDPESSRHLISILEEGGVAVHLNAEVVAVEGEGRVNGIRAGGEKYPADIVIFATGVKPKAEWVSPHVSVKRGVVVDDSMRAEGTYRDIWAAGDVAEWRGMIHGTLSAAEEQASVAALNITGKMALYRGNVRSHTVRCFDTYVTSVGKIAGEEVLKYREENLFVKVFLENGVVVGGIVIGSKKVGVQVDQAVKKGLHVSAVEDILDL